MENNDPDPSKAKLSSLFYYDLGEKRNGFLAKSLCEYKLLLNAAEQASFHFKNGDFEKFDSLVGENACQIRAINIAIIATKGLVDFKSLNTRIAKVKERLEKVLASKKLAFLMSSNLSLREVLENENLELTLTSDEMFILKAFLLSEMKELQPKKELITSLVRIDKSAPKNLKKFDSSISSSFSGAIGSKLRRRLADASINFVRKCAIELNDPSLIAMTSQEYIREHNTYPCIPMFWTYKALLETAKNNSIPLIIHAKILDKQENGYKIREEEILYFKPQMRNNLLAYVNMEPDEVDLCKPACMIEGIVCSMGTTPSLCKNEWRKAFLKHSVIDVILAGAADHRQYPDPNIHIETEDLEYEHYKTLASNNGFSLENPATFFINHVYSIHPEKCFAS